MPITEVQRLNRRNYLCSSDLPRILGELPFEGGTANDVWLEKAHDTVPLKETEAMRYGNMFERFTLNLAKRQMIDYKLKLGEFKGKKFFIDTNPVSTERIKGINMTHPDGLAYLRTKPERTYLPIGFEAKLSRMLSSDWGDSERDIPAHVLLQIHHQIYTADLEYVVCIALLFKKDPPIQFFVIERDAGIYQHIEKITNDWWTKHIVKKIKPPKQPLPSINTLKRILRLPDKIKEDLDVKLVDEWQQARADRLNAVKAEGEKLAALLAELDNSEAALLQDGRLFTYMVENAGMKVNTADFKKLYPEVYTKLAYQATRQVPRVKKNP